MANLLTMSRLVLIPVVVWLVMIGSRLALAVFAIAALTDFLDGAVARRTNKVTEFGRLLDPFVDRLFISSIAIALYFKYSIPPLWALALLVLRDVVILGGSAWLKWRNHELKVTFLGKAATAILLISILSLVGEYGFGLISFYFGLVLYIISGFNYALRGKKILESNRGSA